MATGVSTANPYFVSLDLAGKHPSARVPRSLHVEERLRIPMHEKDARGNTLCYVTATSKDKHRPACLKLANDIWRARFGVTMPEKELECFTLIVVCTQDQRSNLTPVSAARYVYLGKEGIKTAKIYSVASSEDRKGHGSILVKKIKELATGAKCKYMTVDVTRPKFSKTEDIQRFAEDKSEIKTWRQERPDPYRKNENVDSSTRTLRVLGMLRFYSHLGFKRCIAPGNMTEPQRDTPWGPVDPSYSYTLVAVLEDASAPELVLPSRLVPWLTEGQLAENYNSYT